MFELESIIEKAIINVHTWWGHQYAGTTGILVTDDKKVYKYQNYYKIPKDLEEKKANFVIEVKTLNDEEFKQVTEFIENEILNKEYEDILIFDMGFDVTINYKGIVKDIKNNKGDENNLMLYDKAKLLLETI